MTQRLGKVEKTTKDHRQASLQLAALLKEIEKTVKATQAMQASNAAFQNERPPGDLGLTSSRPLQGAAADGAAGKGTMNAQEMAQLSKVQCPYRVLYMLYILYNIKSPLQNTISTRAQFYTSPLIYVEKYKIVPQNLVKSVQGGEGGGGHPQAAGRAGRGEGPHRQGNAQACLLGDTRLK